ncbi:MAG: phasin family protein [Paracoccaceae bacterium]
MRKDTMAQDKFPFADFDKMAEMFRMPELEKMFDQSGVPGLDMMIRAQERNLNAVIEANKVAMAGYQNVAKRQMQMVEESLANAKDMLGEMQGQPMTAEQAQKNMEVARTSFEKSVKDAQELTEMTQKATNEAFEVMKARFEEAVQEFQQAFEQTQAKAQEAADRAASDAKGKAEAAKKSA